MAIDWDHTAVLFTDDDRIPYKWSWADPDPYGNNDPAVFCNSEPYPTARIYVGGAGYHALGFIGLENEGPFPPVVPPATVPIPPGSVIESVRVGIQTKPYYGSACSFTITLFGTYEGPSHNIFSAYFQEDLFETNPATGLPWTYDDLVDGFNVGLTMTGGPMYADAAWMKVTFSTGSIGGAAGTSTALAVGSTSLVELALLPRIVVNSEPVAQGPLSSRVLTDVSILPGTNYAIQGYHWAQVSGPATPVIASPGSANTEVVFDTYVPGVYAFRLTLSGTLIDTGKAGPQVVNDIAIIVPLASAPTVSSGKQHVFY
jgi:hypothetical protein